MPVCWVIHSFGKYLLPSTFELDVVLGTRVQETSDRHVPEVTELTYIPGRMGDKQVNTFIRKTISVPVG